MDEQCSEITFNFWYTLQVGSAGCFTCCVPRESGADLESVGVSGRWEVGRSVDWIGHHRLLEKQKQQQQQQYVVTFQLSLYPLTP